LVAKPFHSFGEIAFLTRVAVASITKERTDADRGRTHQISERNKRAEPCRRDEPIDTARSAANRAADIQTLVRTLDFAVGTIIPFVERKSIPVLEPAQHASP
jgi:hypothetical protein